MKKIIFLLIASSLLTINLYSGEKKINTDLKTESKLGDILKDSKSKKLKLKTDSTLTDMLSGKKKLKIPNPLNAVKKLGNAIKPSLLEK